jgi:hypothetical protein
MWSASCQVFKEQMSTYAGFYSLYQSQIVCLNGNMAHWWWCARQWSPLNFKYLNTPRLRRKGGGLLLFFEDCLSIKSITMSSTQSFVFESAFTELHDGSQRIFIIIIYRLPDTSLKRFRKDFTLLISQLGRIYSFVAISI